MESNEVQPRPWHQRRQPLHELQRADHQVRRRLRHAPRTARRAKATALAAEDDPFVVAAVAAAQSQERVMTATATHPDQPVQPAPGLTCHGWADYTLLMADDEIQRRLLALNRDRATAVG